MDIEEEIYYGNLAHLIMEADKSHSMPCASWKTSKACGIIQSQSEGLKTRRGNGVNPSLRLTRGPENWEATGIRSL